MKAVEFPAAALPQQRRTPAEETSTKQQINNETGHRRDKQPKDWAKVYAAPLQEQERGNAPGTAAREACLDRPATDAKLWDVALGMARRTSAFQCDHCIFDPVLGESELGGVANAEHVQPFAAGAFLRSRIPCLVGSSLAGAATRLT
jgi:hypothetical protein